MTVVKGTVLDAQNGELLPIVNISFKGTNVGTNTDFDGNYLIESQWASDSLEVSYIGYKTQTVFVEKGKSQTFHFKLDPEGLTLGVVEVKAKKQRYRKKNNPAVELMRKVIKNKKSNRLENNEFYAYDKYEKIELDMNNITEKFMNKKIFKKAQFIFDYVDTSAINGKPYLPFFMQETASEVYFRKNPNTFKEYRTGFKTIGLDEYLDDESISVVMDKLYQDVDISKNDILLLGQNFVSPLSVFAVDYYKFYIMDTIQFNGKQCIDMAFIPRNKQNFAFNGNLFIALDSTYQVMNVKMGILKEINLNFIQDLEIEQTFEFVNNRFYKTMDRLVIDYNIGRKGMGFYGKKTTFYQDFDFEEAKDVEVYNAAEKLTILDDIKEKDDAFWEDVRGEQLTEQEQGVYGMVDDLLKVPSFKRVLDILQIAISGHIEVGPVDLGPIGAFYSFNDVEGFRLRFGGRTNQKFSEKFNLEAYGAYGFKDKEPKYAASVLYTFNKSYAEYPKHYIKASYQHETTFPGLVLRFINEDNFFLSFKRGKADQMLFFDSYKLEYFKEYPRDWNVTLKLEKKDQRPIGSLAFNYTNTDGMVKPVEEIKSTLGGVNVRWAPNAEYIKGPARRIPIFNQYPIFTLDYEGHVKDVLGGQNDLHQIRFGIFKKFQLSFLGFSYVDVEFGKIFGKGVPYALLFLPNANQTYAYQLYSYNMMNFLEFSSDQYVSLNIRHYFGGYLFNKIPLFKRLKLREVVTFKGLYGSISDANNPDLHPELIQFSRYEDGVTPQTYSLDDPYLEASAGIANILKLFRIDVVKRFTHLDHPNVPNLWGVKGLGIRGRLVVEF